MSFQRLNNIFGWLIFAIALTVYALSAEPSGSLWDCGEFVSGANKQEVVHPPGAPFFLIVGRLFIWVAQHLSSDKSIIAYAVNLLSGLCTALAVLFMFWTTTILARIALVGRERDEAGHWAEPTTAQTFVILGAGAVAGLATTFCTSIWFSAVEGEVYAMSLFFTAIVIWAMFKWYQLPDEPQNDRWMVFAAYMVGLSIGVHLLSLLAIPGVTLLYYFKKRKTNIRLDDILILCAGMFVILLVPHLAFFVLGGLAYYSYLESRKRAVKQEEAGSINGIMLAGTIGLVILGLIQVGVILILPRISGNFDLVFVNSFGLPVTSGLIFFILLIVGGITAGLVFARRRGNAVLERGLLGTAFVLLGFSTYAMILLRADANTPINMNTPSDAFNLVSYLSREQYGDRPLAYGPHFLAEPTGSNSSDKYGPVKDDKGNVRYEVVDKKVSPEYAPEDMMIFPRMGHSDRAQEYASWMNTPRGQRPDAPGFFENLSFYWRYQLNWEFVRYFMWNFAGRQNGEQGYYSWDPTAGNWLSGIGFFDSARLFDQSTLTDRMRHDPARNTYFFLPLILGIIGLVYHFRRSSQEAFAVLVLFLMLGVAISIYSNQPPNEPRERDYAIAGAMMMFSVWMGLGVVGLYQLFTSRTRLAGMSAAGVSLALALTAPFVMGTQNWDDMSRAGHYAARDYAANFLNSCDKNAIIFTFGDNDTYPLWYAQEVEEIRPDVRVVNLSLLAVDWYIDQLRRKMNQSPAIKMSIKPEMLRGDKRNVVYYLDPAKGEGDKSPSAAMNLADVVKFISENHPIQTRNGETETYLPTQSFTLPISAEDRARIEASNVRIKGDTAHIPAALSFGIGKKSYLQKDEIAILDIINSNHWERPIYFAVTCSPDKALGLNDYMQLEGLALRLTPFRSKGRAELGMLGAGRVQPDLMFDNVMTKFKWGNFDKLRTYIDKSYMPSVISTRYAMLRLGEDLINRKDYARAAKVSDQYFAAFPDFNFEYDDNAAYFLHIYADALGLVDARDPNPDKTPHAFEGKEETMKHLKANLEILTKNTRENLRCYKANPNVDAFARERERIEGGKGRPGLIADIQNLADMTGDAAFATKIKEMLK